MQHLTQQSVVSNVRGGQKTVIVSLVDLAILIGITIIANGGLLLVAWGTREIDRGAYVILLGPINVIVLLLGLACSPLFKRWGKGVNVKIHVVFSLAVPIAMIVVWAIVFMSNYP